MKNKLITNYWLHLSLLLLIFIVPCINHAQQFNLGDGKKPLKYLENKNNEIFWIFEEVIETGVISSGEFKGLTKNISRQTIQEANGIEFTLPNDEVFLGLTINKLFTYKIDFNLEKTLIYSYNLKGFDKIKTVEEEGIREITYTNNGLILASNTFEFHGTEVAMYDENLQMLQRFIPEKSFSFDISASSQDDLALITSNEIEKTITVSYFNKKGNLLSQVNLPISCFIQRAQFFTYPSKDLILSGSGQIFRVQANGQIVWTKNHWLSFNDFYIFDNNILLFTDEGLSLKLISGTTGEIAWHQSIKDLKLSEDCNYCFLKPVDWKHNNNGTIGIVYRFQSRTTDVAPTSSYLIAISKEGKDLSSSKFTEQLLGVVNRNDQFMLIGNLKELKHEK